MKITLEVSEENEFVSFPWWVIVDPMKNMKRDTGIAAGQVTGPFFSREEAEAELLATRYNYSERAIVFCKSGYHSRQYKRQMRKSGMTWLQWFREVGKELIFPEILK